LEKDPHQASELLRKSEVLAENNPTGLAITYNNLACYYRRLGHLRAALIYLEKALDIENQSGHSPLMADTHLNTCAVLSQLNRHDLALQHAHQAIMIVQANLLIYFLPSRDKKAKKHTDSELGKKSESE
jgi:tetratricopeptide (TPR) repeat protein